MAQQMTPAFAGAGSLSRLVNESWRRVHAICSRYGVSPPAILLRESYREAGTVKKRTLLNLSDWPQGRIAGFKMLLKGGTVIPPERQAVTIVRSLPHGHIAAAFGTARKIGLDRLLGPAGNRCRDLVLALVVSRLLDPGSKLAAARALSPDTH
jgi:hypothetical protein